MHDPRREKDDRHRSDDAGGQEAAMRACELHSAIVQGKPSRAAHSCVPMSTLTSVAGVTLVPWGPGDQPLLEKLLGDPAMTEHLGGPETAEQIAARQRRYEQMSPDTGRVFKVVDDDSGEAAGSVMYWEREWREQQVWEIGWSVLPAFQGRGIAGAATAKAIDAARVDGAHRFLHAFPSVTNGPANALCRKLGFALVEERDFEYPKGHIMRCNDWQLDLFG
jgi:RimJ/RimL family protein N-acetyltransferase